MRFRGLALLPLAAAIGFLEILPAAAAADDHPDLSGIWTFYRPPGAPPPGRRAGPGPAQNDTMKPEARAKVEAYQALVKPTGDSPGGWCVGTGMPGSLMFSGAYPMEIIQRPEQVTIIYEAHTELRRVYMSGPHTQVPDSDLFPTRSGYSIGHWDGDELVVETKALEEQVDQMTAHSANARIVERYKLGKDDNGNKILTAQVTMTDPDFYTEPVHLTKTWAASEERSLYYDCTEPAWEEHLEKLKEQAGQ